MKKDIVVIKFDGSIFGKVDVIGTVTIESMDGYYEVSIATKWGKPCCGDRDARSKGVAMIPEMLDHNDKLIYDGVKYTVNKSWYNNDHGVIDQLSRLDHGWLNLGNAELEERDMY